MPVCPKTNQPEQDVVYTPHSLAKEIIDHYKPTGLILEPCRGGGAFSDQMNCDWCEIQEGIDFFEYTQSPDWIITNPPWSKIRQFLDHSFTINTKNLVYLCNFNAFVTKARLRTIYGRGYGIKEVYCVQAPKEHWPQQGFQLAATHIQRGYNGPIYMTGHIGL
ncbi:MAG: hypothetical protein N0C84_00760 [Candidatus Thiodiazotropha taylori]|uniref:Uncharacterized protein n=1 Tax=Candidatus Thiodiazotropha taylori TaxID=2792791 RepID=A0A9E4N220_9GAMM|nr:hypothetical protein [Candidatus Thiodiazotropha taylori]MCW4254976.1 hypothetical protein [Candidatus Thiodiazotropha taylori]